jgi:hypothetical protein
MCRVFVFGSGAYLANHTPTHDTQPLQEANQNSTRKSSSNKQGEQKAFETMGKEFASHRHDVCVKFTNNNATKRRMLLHSM